VRRRRRRGSRRRTDRVGAGGEGGDGTGSADGGVYEDGDGEDELEPGGLEDELEITPTTSIADVAQASGGTVEELSEEGPDVEPAPVEPEQTVSELATYGAEAASEPVEVPAEPPKPRDRRRRTRRVAAGADAVGTQVSAESDAAGAPA